MYNKRIKELKEQIRIADDCYWKTGASHLSDSEYDALVEELNTLCKEEQKFRSPEVTSEGKVVHPVPMLSMQKVYSATDVVKWYERYGKGCTLTVMPKYDGIAIANYGYITATRGDGELGEDVTKVANPIMMFVSEDDVYGELVCTYANFALLKGYGYKNPRNAVSGIMNSLDTEIQKRACCLTFVPYDTIAVNLTEVNAESVQATADSICILASDYPLDGVVFRISDDDKFYELGHTDHHWRGQIALKFRNAFTESVIESIEWQEANGTVTPVAHIAPVTLGGAEISRVTLHNATRVIAWDIRVGDKCVVERAGGVVPKITQTYHEAHDALPRTVVPSNCPTCETKLVYRGKRLCCPKCDK